MSQFKDIPQGTDNRNVSQGDILQNFEYLATPANGVRSGVKPGILQVDHVQTGDNVAHATDGFHNQVSFFPTYGTVASTLNNSINSQSSSAILYVTNDSAASPNPQLHYFNGTGTGQMDFPISCVKAFVNFSVLNTSPFTVTVNSSFNIADVNRISLGKYKITFSNILPNANYCVTGISTSNFGGTFNFLQEDLSLRTTTTSGIVLYNNNGIPTDSTSINVVYIGI